MAIEASQGIIKVASTICSWAPTMAVLLLFPKLQTGFDRRRDFIKSRFQGKGYAKTALLLFVVQAIVFFAAAGLISVYCKIPYNELFQLSASTVLLAIVSTALGGALGEELGWRGFLFWEHRKEHGVIKSSVYNGIIWTLWHIPLWFIRGGNGKDLLIYILAFALSAISAAIIMGVFYQKTKNLAVPMVIHFSLNFWVCLIRPEIPAHLILSAIAILYFIAAICCIIYQRKCDKI